jgi:hypothetical protein
MACVFSQSGPAIAYKLGRTLDRCLYWHSRTRRAPRRCVIYGNCQGWPIALLLTTHRQFRQQYSILKIPPVQDLQPSDERRVLTAVREADLFLYQPVQDGYRGLPFAGTKFLVQENPPAALKLSFPSLYFRGYSPEIIYIRRPDGRIYDGPASHYHNTHIIEQYSAGRPASEALAHLLNAELVPAEQSLAVAEHSLEELRRHETDARIRVSDFVAQNLRRQRLFLTVNHPALALLAYVAQKILERLGIDPFPVSWLRTLQGRLGYEPLGATYFSIHPATYRNLNLAFPNPQRFVSRHGAWNLPTVVRNFYRYYDQHPEVLEAYRQKLVH